MLQSVKISPPGGTEPEEDSSETTASEGVFYRESRTRGGIVFTDSLFLFKDKALWFHGRESGWFYINEYQKTDISAGIWEFRTPISSDSDKDTVITIYNYEFSNDLLFLRRGSEYHGNNTSLIGQWKLFKTRDYDGKIVRDTSVIEFTDSSCAVLKTDKGAGYDYAMPPESAIKIVNDTVYSLPGNTPFLFYKIIDGKLLLWNAGAMIMKKASSPPPRN